MRYGNAKRDFAPKRQGWSRPRLPNRHCCTYTRQPASGLSPPSANVWFSSTPKVAATRQVVGSGRELVMSFCLRHVQIVSVLNNRTRQYSKITREVQNVILGVFCLLTFLFPSHDRCRYDGRRYRAVGSNTTLTSRLSTDAYFRQVYKKRKRFCCARKR